MDKRTETEWFDEVPWPGPSEHERIPIDWAGSGITSHGPNTSITMPAGESLNVGDLVYFSPYGKARAFSVDMPGVQCSGVVTGVTKNGGIVSISYR